MLGLAVLLVLKWHVLGEYRIALAQQRFLLLLICEKVIYAPVRLQVIWQQKGDFLCFCNIVTNASAVSSTH